MKLKDRLFSPLERSGIKSHNKIYPSKCRTIIVYNINARKVGKQLFHINVRNKDGKRACTGEEQKETLCKHLGQKKVNLRDPYLNE